jgi:hypothetical protein
VDEINNGWAKVNHRDLHHNNIALNEALEGRIIEFGAASIDGDLGTQNIQ